MTIKEAVTAAREELYKVNIPAALIKEIGSHLGNAIDILSACVEACERAEQEEKGDKDV